MVKNIELLKQAKETAGGWGHLNQFRLETTLKFAGSSVLDLGCSSGLYVKHLAVNGYFACGLDILPDDAWAGNSSATGNFLVGDVCAIPFPSQSFDTIIAFETLEHIADIDLALQEIHRVSRQNIVISVPDCEIYPEYRNGGLVPFHWIDRTHRQFFT
ncbi:MAG: class I SAM-dependent methyltransferase [Chloroflexota bacterium]